MLGNAMPTDSGNEDSGESPQYALRQEEEIGEIEEEIGEISVKTQISRGFGIALIVIAGLAIVALVSIFGSSSDKVATAAQAVPLGGLTEFIGTVVFLLIAVTVFIVAAPIIMGIFGAGLIASGKSDNPEKRGTVAKVARGCGITALWVAGLFCVAVFIILN